ncbi:MAG: prolipoprotein diacylglyceryl transferase [Cyclobacteriaceae bacterium]
MHPKFFSIAGIDIHGYGFMIMVGALCGYYYVSGQAKKELNIPAEKIQNLAVLIILMAVVGGKLLFYLEDPKYYFNPPSNMFKNFRQGFVFYGSLIFVLPAAIWYFRKEKWPLWEFLDILAIAGPIIHIFGRMGCLMAGCCYGLPTDSFLGITFTDPHTQARPAATPLHPTQLYEIALIGTILVVLWMLKRYDRFKHRLIFVYVMLYAAGRSVTEMFRGDLRRGFIIEDVLSHSQFISILLICVCIAAIYRLKKKL